MLITQHPILKFSSFTSSAEATQMTQEITGPKGIPFFGMAFEFKKDPLQFLKSIDQEYGGIARFNFSHLPMVFVSAPEHIRHVLQGNNKNYHKGIEFRFLKYTLGEGLLTSEGDFWLRQRRLAQPAFHRNRIASFAEVITASTTEMLEEWKQKRKAVDVHVEMMRLTLDIVGKTLLGSQVKSTAEQVERAMGAIVEDNFGRIQTLVNPPLWFPAPKNLKLKTNIKALDEVVLRIIEEHRKTPENYNDLLSMLMEVKDEDTGEQMNDRQLRDEVMTIFLAGHETTANALAWALFCLSENPAVEQKFQQEIQTVLQGRTPTFEDAKALNYTMCIVQETLRMYPPAWAFGRKALADDEINGFRVRKGDNLIVAPFVTQRNPKLWENPDEFQPERFEGDRAKKLDKFQYFPFGGGPRLCIGNNFALLEMQLVLAMIGQANLKLKMDEKHQVILEPLVTLRPKGGLPMQFA